MHNDRTSLIRIEELDKRPIINTKLKYLKEKQTSFMKEFRLHSEIYFFFVLEC